GEACPRRPQGVPRVRRDLRAGERRSAVLEGGDRGRGCARPTRGAPRARPPPPPRGADRGRDDARRGRRDACRAGYGRLLLVRRSMSGFGHVDLRVTSLEEALPFY